MNLPNMARATLAVAIQIDRTPMIQDRDMRNAIKQLGLYEKDPQVWSLARLQRWITEAEHLLADMHSCTDSEVSELRALVVQELNRKKELLTRIWIQ